MLFGGVPAKIICSIEEYEEKRKNNFLYTKMMNEKEKKEYLLKQCDENSNKFLKR